MNNLYNKQLEFNYESNASGNFLVISIDASKDLHQYQVGILTNNPHKNILPLDIRQKDEKHNLYYNITSKLSLSQYLKHNKINKNSFITVFSGITKTILSSKNYLFSENSFLLMEDYIYVNPNNLEVALAYLPFNVGDQLNINFILKEFTKNFIINSANIDESSNDNFIKRVINLLKLDNFNVLEFEKLLNELDQIKVPKAEHKIPNESSRQSSEQVTHSSPAPSNVQNNKSSPFSKSFNKPDMPINRPTNKPTNIPTNIPTKKGSINIPSTPKSTSLKKQKTKNSPNASSNNQLAPKYKTNIVVLGIILQSIIVIGSVLLLTSSALDFLGNDMTTNIIAVVILVGALSLLLWKNILNPKNITEDISIKKPAPGNFPSKITKKKINTNKKQKVNTNKKEIISFSQDKNSSIENIPPNMFAFSLKNSDHTTLLSPNDLYETTLLSPQEASPPYLQSNRDGVLEKIKITKPEFLIGRLRDQVDYISQNKAIGKVHAEIIIKDGKYFLKDLNSRNGTYVNDKRLNSNIEYEIKNNDVIVFANSKYVFKVP